MKIELPDALHEWAREQAELRGCADADAFVAQVLLGEQQRWRERVDARLLSSLESGDPIEVAPEFWAEQQRALEESLREPGKAAG